MSLTSALYSSFAGLAVAEAQISIVSQNVTNADKAGYTKKEYDLEYSLAGGTSVPVSGTVVSSNVDSYLLEEVIGDITSAAASQITESYITYLSDQMGGTAGSTTLSSSLDDLMTSFDTLSVTPEDDALKSQIISDAEEVASQIRGASQDVQDLRTQADQAIDNTVDQINDLLVELNSLNYQVSTAEVQGVNSADIKDVRNSSLQELAALIDIQYFINSNDQLNVYVEGYAVLSSQANLLEYQAAGSLDSTVSYPAQLDGITLNGVDITGSIDGGELGALIELRDVILVEEQDKLDEYAEVLIVQLNTLSNQGASIPPRSDIIGDVEGLAGGDAFSATGILRIATMSQSGTVMSYNDLDLSTYATITDVVSGINTAFGGDVTASLTADGQLQIVANNADEGVSMNEMDSSVGTDNLGFSNYFGLNNVFDGTDATDISVSSYLQDDFEYLATSRLSDSATLAVGDTAIYVGDSDLAKEMNGIFEVQVSFDSAGNFAAQTASLTEYSGKIMSDLAGRADDAIDQASTMALILDQTLTALENMQGVNIDEELANLVDFEAKYEAAALLLSVIQDLYDTLVGAVR